MKKLSQNILPKSLKPKEHYLIFCSDNLALSRRPITSADTKNDLSPSSADKSQSCSAVIRFRVDLRSGLCFNRLRAAMHSSLYLALSSAKMLSSCSDRRLFSSIVTLFSLRLFAATALTYRECKGPSISFAEYEI